ncbi:MAG: phage tail tape measure protein [Prevotellaceae bacterium]|jgi:hypothetical protein|nr:phage tail tape measure protein [Prevotellaceae bacterium]
MTSDKALKLGFLLTATDKMSKTLEAAGKNLTEFQKRIADMGANASRIGGHFMTMGNQIGGGMLNIVKAAADYAETSVANATKVGMNVGEWQKLAYAADMAGLSQEKLTAGMTNFNDTLKKAVTGEGGAFFRKFGIQVTGANGKIRAHQDILKDVANVFARIKGNSPEKSILSQELLGKVGPDFIKLLNGGAAGIEKMAKRLEELGLANGDNTTAGGDFAKALKDMDYAVLSLKVSLGSVLAPVLGAFANILASVTGWLSGLVREYPGVAKVLSFVAGGIGAFLFAASALKVTIGAVALVFSKCTKIIRGAQAALLFFKGIINGTRGATYAALLTQRQFTVATKLHAIGVKIAAIAQKVWNGAVRAGTVALDKLRYGVIGTTVKKGALAVASGISTAAQWLWNGALMAGRAVLTFFTSGVIFSKIAMVAMAVWQGIVTVAQWLFNAALYACPIVWIIAGIMAVIAVVVLMVKYWDDIVAFFEGVWEGIKNVFSAVGDWIVNLFSGIFSWFSELPAKFVEFGKNIIQGLINGILGAVGKLWETIKNIGKSIGKFFTKILGISSPSTVFAKYGMNITQGLVVGIDRGESKVEHAVGGLAVQAISSYGNSVQTVPVGNMGGGMGFNYAPTINIGAGVSEGTKQDFAAMLRQHYREIVDIMQRHTEDKTRISFM